MFSINELIKFWNLEDSIKVLLISKYSFDSDLSCSGIKTKS